MKFIWLGRICENNREGIEIAIIPFIFSNLDEFVKSRHSRAGGNPESMKLIEKTGFPFSRE